MVPEETVFWNLHDSVSRIVENMGFTSIEVAAHAKLVGLLGDKLEMMSHTCRELLENSGRRAISLNPIDIKHVFRLNQIDIQGLRLYTESVAPFPPTKSTIHGEKAVVRCNENKETQKKTTSKAAEAKLQKHPTPPIIEFPIFDDLSDFQLGFGTDNEEPDTAKPVPPSFETPSKSVATILEPPPPPPPIPPLFFSPPATSVSCSSLYSVEDPFNSPDNTWPYFAPNYTTPDFIPPPNFPTFKPHISPPIEKQAIKEPRKAEKSASKSRKSGQKLEKAVSSSSISSAKLTKKRLMQTNYERRLRHEQMANEERKKEKKYEKRRAEKEKIKTVGRNKEGTKERFLKQTEYKETRLDKNKKARDPSLVFKLKPGTFEALMKLERVEKASTNNGIGHNSIVSNTKTIDVNDNNLMRIQPLKRAKLEEVAGLEDVIASREPLPKMRISFRRLKHGETGVLIKKIIKTSYVRSKGSWEPYECQWKSTNGVYSKPLQPHRPQPANVGSIPKLRLIKNADNSYSKV